jgi:hypothetical protein
VLVLEKDQRELAPDVEAAAAAAFRSTAPHIVQPHVIMARCRQLLIEHLPDVYEQLLRAGVVDQAAIDSARLAMLRHFIFGAPAPVQPPLTADRVTYAQLRTAALFDQTAFRAFWRILGMIRRPEEEYTDPQIVARTHETLREHGSGPQVVQPTREQLLAALDARAR